MLDEGEIVERGDHGHLIREDGLYANLWHVQGGEMDALPDSVLRRSLEADAG